MTVETFHETSLLPFNHRTSSLYHFNPTQQEDPDVTQSAEDRPIGGLGIFLVRQIMDDIRYERKDDKNILTLTKHICK